jgi:putative ABC transport system permease protein
VVGIVGDTRFFGWDHDDGTFTYFPYRSLKARLHYAVAVRTFGDAEGTASAVRQVVGSVDKELPLVEVATMQKRLDKAFAPHRFNTAVIAGFACIATALAAIGVFGLVAFVVSQRTREFGLRMALGAERRDILRFVLAQILTLSIVGIASGLPFSFAASRLMQAMLYHPNPLDIPAFIVSGVVLMTTSLGAALIPAFRAAQIDPMQALRCD